MGLGRKGLGVRVGMGCHVHQGGHRLRMWCGRCRGRRVWERCMHVLVLVLVLVWSVRDGRDRVRMGTGMGMGMRGGNRARLLLVACLVHATTDTSTTARQPPLLGCCAWRTC